jgi:hypothetical protein
MPWKVRGRCKPARPALAQLLRYPEVIMEAIRRAVPRTKLERSLLAATCEMSTHFSGMGTVEVAADMVCQAAQQILGLTCVIKSVSLCDSSNNCQNVLRATCDRGADGEAPCIFPDVIKLVQLPQGRSKSCDQFLESARRRVMKSRISKRAQCAMHSRASCAVRAGHFSFGGTPCTDFSAIGGRARFAGETMEATVAWFGIVKHLPFGIHENVVRFPQELAEIVEATHRIITLRTTPGDVGFGRVISRPRVYRLLVRIELWDCWVCKDVGWASIDMYKENKRNSRRHDLQLLADPEEVFHAIRQRFAAQNPVHWTALLGSSKLVKVDLQKRCKCATKCTCTHFSQLTDHQQRRLRQYKAGLRQSGTKLHGQLCHLGDNPTSRWICGPRLPTLRTTMGPIWTFRHKRWLTRREIGAAMGWPWKHLKPRMPFGTPGLLGNSMHLANAVAVLATVLSCLPAAGVLGGSQAGCSPSMVQAAGNSSLAPLELCPSPVRAAGHSSPVQSAGCSPSTVRERALILAFQHAMKHSPVLRG